MSEHATYSTGAIGTVTFLLARVQDGATLSERDPDAMKAAHSRYEELLQGAAEANGGDMLRTTGNAIQVAFPTAVQAVQAAIDAQLLLFTEQWPPSIGDLQVAMALHTGHVDPMRNVEFGMRNSESPESKPIPHSEFNIPHSAGGGPTLNRASGLLAAGHGGQVLLSATTQGLVRDFLSQLQPADPPGVQLLDLGEHRLDDLSHPEHIYQLVVPALSSHFPPLRTLDSLPNNLPRRSTPIIGREKQIADVVALLHRPGVSLVTLIGPAGTGKTRLSLEIGARILEEYRDEVKDGVWFVELATLSSDDHKLVPSAIAEAMHVREVPGQEVVETLKGYMRDKQMLLVLDNFEQLTSAASQLVSLLKAAPHLKVLVTSRIPVRVYGEREYRVPPLTLPDRKTLQEPSHPTKDEGRRTKDDRQVGTRYSVLATAGQVEQQADGQVEQYMQCEAVRLFVDRCQAVKADFEITAGNAHDIAAICTRLDGLPLAIELAAARIRLFTPQALLGRLSDRMKILTGGARDLPARQQTMRGALEWSYDLLSEEEKLLFSRMAVFTGGSTLEDAEAVCAMRNVPNVEWRMRNSELPGSERIPHSEFHIPHSLDVLDGIQSLLDQSLLVEREGRDGGTRYWMLETIHEYAYEKLKEKGEEDALEREHALYFMRLAEEAEPELVGNRQAEWLNRLEDEHDNLRATIQWAITRARAGQSEEAIDAEEVGLRTAGALWMFWEMHGHFSEGRQLLAGVLDMPVTARLESIAEESDAARQEVMEARARRAKALMGAGNLADKQGDYAAARALNQESLAIRWELNDKRGIAASLNNLALLEGRRGDYAAARSLHEESLAIRREAGDKSNMSASLNNLGVVAYILGDFPAARSLFEETLALCRELGDKLNLAGALSNLAAVVYSLGDYPAARALNEESLAMKREVGDKSGVAISLNNLGDVTCMLGDYSAARSLYEQSLALMQELEDKGGIAHLLHGLGNVIYCEGDYPAALALYEESLEMKRELEDKDAIAASLSSMGSVAVKLQKAQRGAKLLGAAEALLQTTGAVLEPTDHLLQTQGESSARAQLGDGGLERLKAEGGRMSMEEAIEYALQPAADEPTRVQSDEERLERQRQVDELRIKIDHDKKARQVEAITGTEYFVQLQARAKALVLARQQRAAGT